jgi:hypothetical protein
VGVLTIGAHFGGSMTHGEAYLFKYAPKFVQRLFGEEPAPPPPPASATPPSAEPLVYADLVQSIMQKRCVECHGTEKTKANLRLDSIDAMIKGGDNGPTVRTGRGADSRLVKRMLLPASDDEHMPPDDRDGPSAEEIDLIKWWIDRGATDTLRVKDGVVSDGARSLLAKAAGRAAPAPVGK